MVRRPTTVGTSGPTTVGVFPIGDPKDDHNQPVIPNCVDDPIVAYANPVEVVYPAKLLDTVRPWFKVQIAVHRYPPQCAPEFFWEGWRVA